MVRSFPSLFDLLILLTLVCRLFWSSYVVSLPCSLRSTGNYLATVRGADAAWRVHSVYISTSAVDVERAIVDCRLAATK